MTEDWSEDTATWDNAEDISREQDPVDTSVVPEEQLGGTEYVVSRGLSPVCVFKTLDKLNNA